MVLLPSLTNKGIVANLKDRLEEDLIYSVSAGVELGSWPFMLLTNDQQLQKHARSTLATFSL